MLKYLKKKIPIEHMFVKVHEKRKQQKIKAMKLCGEHIGAFWKLIAQQEGYYVKISKKKTPY